MPINRRPGAQGRGSALYMPPSRMSGANQRRLTDDDVARPP